MKKNIEKIFMVKYYAMLVEDSLHYIFYRNKDSILEKKITY